MSSSAKGVTLVAVLAVLARAPLETRAQTGDSSREKGGYPSITAENASCVSCHGRDEKTGKLGRTPGVVAQWAESVHAQRDVGCMDCHSGRYTAGEFEGEAKPYAWTHEGTLMSSIVTPLDCAECHPRETVEFSASHHNTAAMFIGSLDNFLGSFVEGKAAAVMGCQQCHGSPVKLTKTFEDGSKFRLDMEAISSQAIGKLKAAGKDPRKSKDALEAEMGRLIAAAYKPHEGKKSTTRVAIDSDTWPNSGVGRFNPDGSLGTCNACHSRHSFSKALARQPDNCGKCHMGPDHPQIEVYNESKHGVAYRNRLAEMNLDHPEWVVGRDYSAAPTCSTCHMSAYIYDGELHPATHDVGLRISWTLRPVISTKTESHSATLNEDGEVVRFTLGWKEKRQNMQEVCSACHEQTHIENFYKQFDGLVDLYNNKFAAPAQELMNLVKAEKLIRADVPFGSKLEWIYFELWHHEGRRMRHGAAMMGPDYTHWHGSYEVAKHFYFEFLPSVEELAREHKNQKVLDAVAKLRDRKEHSWLKGLSPEQRRNMLDFYESRYGQKTVTFEGS